MSTNFQMHIKRYDTFRIIAQISEKFNINAPYDYSIYFVLFKLQTQNVFLSMNKLTLRMPLANFLNIRHKIVNTIYSSRIGGLYK